MMLLNQTRPGLGRELPLIDMNIPAGPPTPAEHLIEDKIDLSAYLAPHPDTSFLIRVEGESMLEAGIHPGDLLVVERTLEPHNGDVVIAQVGDCFTVKRLRRARGNLWLVSANKDYPDPLQDDFTVWGVVRYSIHKV